MKLLEPKDYPFLDVEIMWHGPFTWRRGRSVPDWDDEISELHGWYRAEQSGRLRPMIKYIGSATGSFVHRLSRHRRIKTELLEKQRETRIFLGVQQSRIRLSRTQFVEIEYILQNVHWQDLISLHGLAKLPKTSRGMAWRIKNSGKASSLYRYIHYPTFAIAQRAKEVVA
jgi:hypothetical protein